MSIVVLTLLATATAAVNAAHGQQLPLMDKGVMGDIGGSSRSQVRTTSWRSTASSTDHKFPTCDFTRNTSALSTVDWQINITANTGDFGALNGTYHICDYLEEMHQPPSNPKPLKQCPPHEGRVLINFAAWFADWLVAPGNWSVRFDAKAPDGKRIYCLQSEFDLQCPPDVDKPECLRDVVGESIDVNQRLQHARDWMIGRRRR